MPNQEINLSDALDLIAQSKSNIKDSVEYKNGGNDIGENLTTYDSAIREIKYRSLQNSWGNYFVYGRYLPEEIHIQQYLDGNLTYVDPSTVSFDVQNVVPGDEPTFSIQVLPRGAGENFLKLSVTSLAYGESNLIMTDEIGNCDYLIQVNTPPYLYGYPEVSSFNGFTDCFWNDGSHDITAIYDETANSFDIRFILKLHDDFAAGLNFPVSVSQTSFDGVDTSLVTPSMSTGHDATWDEDVWILNITPDSNFTTTAFNVNITDGTSTLSISVALYNPNDYSPE